MMKRYFNSKLHLNLDVNYVYMCNDMILNSKATSTFVLVKLYRKSTPTFEMISYLDGWLVDYLVDIIIFAC